MSSKEGPDPYIFIVIAFILIVGAAMGIFFDRLVMNNPDVHNETKAFCEENGGYFEGRSPFSFRDHCYLVVGNKIMTECTIRGDGPYFLYCPGGD